MRFCPSIQILIDKYTWRGTFIINAGILLNGTICALVLRPPDETLTPLFKEGLDKEEKELLETDKNRSDYRVSRLKLMELHCCKGNVKTAKENRVIQTHGTNYEVNRSENPNVENITDKGSDNLSECQENENDSLSSVTIEYRPSTEKGPSVDSSEIETTRFETTQSEMFKKIVDESVENDPFMNSTSVTITEKNNQTGSQELKPRRLFSLAPLKNPGFLCFLVAEILIQLSLNTPFTFLPDMMLHKGFQTHDAVWMLFIIGMKNII